MKYILMFGLQKHFTEENSRLKCFFFPSFQLPKFGGETKSKLLSSNLVSAVASLITPMLHIINQIFVFKDGLTFFLVSFFFFPSILFLCLFLKTNNQKFKFKIIFSHLVLMVLDSSSYSRKSDSRFSAIRNVALDDLWFMVSPSQWSYVSALQSYCDWLCKISVVLYWFKFPSSWFIVVALISQLSNA